MELDELGAGGLGEDRAAVAGDQQVLVALGDEDRAADAAHQLARGGLVHVGRLDRERERVRRALEPPADRVLDLLRRVRLRHAAAEEELEVAAEVLLPVVAVGLRPALVVGEDGLEVVAGALGPRG